MERYPSISYYQASLLSWIKEAGDGGLSGQKIRRMLAEIGDNRTGPNFYLSIGKMEDMGLVVGEYTVTTIGSKTYRERIFRITESGLADLAYFVAFAGAIERRFNGNLGVQPA